ncbi:MAG: hypothetical protein MI754_02695, partial [Chromatiales bacterium]|nr:hypothetical protein [Chromatiales bacterium]
MSKLTASLLLIGALISTSAWASYPLEIITLTSRPVSEVLPIIKPFISPDGSVSGMQNQLIIRTSPDNLEEIKEILAKIDTPARRLMISVRQGESTNQQRQGISADISTMVGKNAKVIVGQPNGGSRT